MYYQYVSYLLNQQENNAFLSPNLLIIPLSHHHSISTIYVLLATSSLRLGIFYLFFFIFFSFLELCFIFFSFLGIFFIFLLLCFFLCDAVGVATGDVVGTTTGTVVSS
mmetsp:Transcript_16371/g.18662  ORF Transcript_16371/g.18662 Transcript_16371/m.18662 type:complete len:108 (+) Transcript_16371:89-412(+)